ncbi:MAG: leucine-rich repeat domain-containing protein [Paludibacteraceae bacterium]|nr:leucine-rich repeat domain-containing protein [Paludibacteraceae bacterium]
MADYDYEEEKRGSERFKNLCIPEKVIYEGNEYIVDEILEWAFALCKTMVTLEIPDSVKQIGESAFESCEALE